MNNELDKHQMFLDNDKLIYLTMKKYFPHIYANLDSREEYYQIGAIGLLKAIERYDDNLSAFSTYATHIIWGEMKRNIRDNSGHIHYSRKIIDISNNLIVSYHGNDINSECEDWLNNQLNELDISHDDKVGIINYIFKTISLDVSTNDDETLSVADSIASTENISNDIEYTSYIENISKKLNSKEKKVFLEFLNGEKQTAIGNKTGLSQAQVSRIQKKIKILVIKELYDSEQFETAINKIYDLNNKRKIDINDLTNICQQYRIDLSKCPKHILEKRMNNMPNLIQKNYSKKSCQKLILKSVIKLLLKDKDLTNNDRFKQLVKKMLIDNNYNNETILNHLTQMSTSQINSCINLAKKTIEKYDYKYEYEIIIDELDFNPSKFIKKERMYEIKSDKSDDTSKLTSSDNLIESVISILECFKKDNLMVRF